jgi:hypothetical protein
MSMRIQDACSNCCDGIREFASQAAAWISQAASNTGNFITETTAKVAEFIKPQFENLRALAKENKQGIIIASVAFGIGAALAAAISTVFCKETNMSAAAPAPAPAPVPQSAEPTVVV